MLRTSPIGTGQTERMCCWGLGAFRLPDDSERSEIRARARGGMCTSLAAEKLEVSKCFFLEHNAYFVEFEEKGSVNGGLTGPVDAPAVCSQKRAGTNPHGLQTRAL